MASPRAGKPTRRLSRKDWLAAGLLVLSEAGAAGLKAEPLARYLRTTKGSFYWHFKDVPAFHGALLGLWEETVLAGLDAAADPGLPPATRLRRLAQAIAAPDRQNAALTAEPAVRGWARRDPKARASLARVDAARLGQLRALLSQTGIGNPEMARIIHAAAIGMTQTGAPEAGDIRAAMGSLVDLVLALR